MFFYIHAKVNCDYMQEIDGVILLARRRSNDEKATVRRAGLQMLELLLLMGVKGFGGAPVQLPCEADLDAIRSATADPLVSFNSLDKQTRMQGPIQCCQVVNGQCL